MRAYVVAHGVRLERERNRPGALVARSAHQEHQRTGDVSARVDVLRGAAAKSRMPRKSLAGPSVLITGPSVMRFGAADDVVEPQASASRVVCRCLEWPQAVSGVLKSAATLPTVPVGVLLAPGNERRARSMLHGSWERVEGWRSIATRE